uniref:LemA family protein n=1 Tax=Meloidogyne hapla TaxID=6305 RepID=A0A1I8BXQ0_MELHA
MLESQLSELTERYEVAEKEKKNIASGIAQQSIIMLNNLIFMQPQVLSLK